VLFESEQSIEAVSGAGVADVCIHCLRHLNDRAQNVMRFLYLAGSIYINRLSS
jgi:hypothetical protein